MLELYRVWPHVAALRATAVLDVSIDNPEISSFMEKHASHTLQMLNESGSVHGLKKEVPSPKLERNIEAERLWKAVLLCSGGYRSISDRNQNASGTYPGGLLPIGPVQKRTHRFAYPRGGHWRRTRGAVRRENHD